MAEGPFPEHYEPFESPLGQQPAAPEQSAGARQSRRRACSRTTARHSARSKDFPYVATTYRLTEHFHYWTKHVAPQRDHCSRSSSWRSARSWPRRRASRHGDRVKVTLQARPHHGGGGRHQAHQGAEGRRQEGAHGRHPDPLGLQGPGEAGLSGQHADARSSATPTRRRRSSSRSWSTSRKPRRAVMALQSLDIKRRSATTTPSPSVRERTTGRSPS